MEVAVSRLRLDAEHLLADVLDDRIGHLVGDPADPDREEPTGVVRHAPVVLAGPADHLLRRGLALGHLLDPAALSSVRPESISSWRISATNASPSNPITCHLHRRPVDLSTCDACPPCHQGTSGRSDPRNDGRCRQCGGSVPSPHAPHRWPASTTAQGTWVDRNGGFAGYGEPATTTTLTVDGTAYRITCDPTMAALKAIREIAGTPVPAGAARRASAASASPIVDGAETPPVHHAHRHARGRDHRHPRPSPQHLGLTRLNFRSGCAVGSCTNRSASSGAGSRRRGSGRRPGDLVVGQDHRLALHAAGHTPASHSTSAARATADSSVGPPSAGRGWPSGRRMPSPSASTTLAASSSEP